MHPPPLRSFAPFPHSPAAPNQPGSVGLPAAPPAVASTAIDATSTEVDTEYGSTHRANMMQSRLLQEGSGIELTLVYNAGRGGSVLPARAPPILRKASETAV